MRLSGKSHSRQAEEQTQVSGQDLGCAGGGFNGVDDRRAIREVKSNGLGCNTVVSSIMPLVFTCRENPPKV